MLTSNTTGTQLAATADPLRRRVALLALGAGACAVIAALLLLWVVMTAIGKAAVPGIVASLSALVLSYAVELAAVTLQVLSHFVRYRLQEPRPIGPFLSLVLVIPVLGCQLYLVLLFFIHGPVR